MKRTLFALLLLTVLAGTAAADSQFAANGLGVGMMPTHARGWTMGRLGIALDDSLRLSLANPAAPGGTKRVSMSAVYLADRRRARDENGEIFFTTSGFPLFEFLIPFGSRFALGFGYDVEQDMGTARTRIPFETDPESGVPAHTRFFERRGALFRVPALATFRLFRDLRLGFRLDSYFFNIEEDYDLVFDDTSIRTTRERLVMGGSGTGGTFGLMVPLLRFGHAGFVYSTSATLDGDREREGASGSVDKEAVRVEVPERFGAGITLKPAEQWTVGGEISTAAWEDVSDTLSALGGYSDVVSYGFGVERMPGRDDPWFLAFPIRAGYRIEPLSLVSEEGREIDRRIFSCGSGFVLGEGRGRCDFGLEYGRIGSRANIGMEESWYRFVIGFTGQEPWRKRKSYVE